MTDEKIDIHYSQKMLEQAKKNFERAKINAHNKKYIQDFINQAALGRFSPSGAHERRLRDMYYRMIGINSQLGDKPFNELTREEYEEWWANLKHGNIKSKKGTPYSQHSIRDFVRDLKTFLSWYEDGIHYGKVKWFSIGKKTRGKVRRESKSKTAYTLDQVKAAVDKLDYLPMKFYIAMAFDSGARPEELHNCRVRDLTWVENEQEPSKSCYWLNVRYSKNDQMPRNIPVPLFTELYKEYEGECLLNRDENDSILLYHHRTYYRWLKHLQEREIFPHITHYVLRHSSWTYWGPIIKDKFQLNKRMGETLTSDMADTYINDDIMNTDFQESIVASRKDEIADLKKELAELKELTELAEVKEFLDLLKGMMNKQNSHTSR